MSAEGAAIAFLPCLRVLPYCVVMRGVAELSHNELPLLPPMPCRVSPEKIQNYGLSRVP